MCIVIWLMLIVIWLMLIVIWLMLIVIWLMLIFRTSEGILWKSAWAKYIWNFLKLRMSENRTTENRRSQGPGVIFISFIAFSSLVVKRAFEYFKTFQLFIYHLFFLNFNHWTFKVFLIRGSIVYVWPPEKLHSADSQHSRSFLITCFQTFSLNRTVSKMSEELRKSKPTIKNPRRKVG